MTPLKIRNSTLKLYVLNGILLVTSVFAFCPPPARPRTAVWGVS